MTKGDKKGKKRRLSEREGMRNTFESADFPVGGGRRWQLA